MKKANRLKDDAPEFVKDDPYVDDTGIYVPASDFRLEEQPQTFRMLMSAEIFREAYRRFILEADDGQKDDTEHSH